jgi:thiaminase/transcriptional activator TenA
VPRFTDDLRRACASTWAASHAHPFVRGIADGSLDEARFRWFLRQDYVYLGEYARALALTGAHAPTEALAVEFARRAQATLEAEMALHRTFAAEWGVTPEQLAAERPALETRAYADFITASASTGGFPAAAAALLPCVWSYVELGAALASGPRSPDERYARWIEAYASAEQAELADSFRTIVDDVAAEGGEATRQSMRDAFAESSLHELAFWDMAWRGDPRPGERDRGSA